MPDRGSNGDTGAVRPGLLFVSRDPTLARMAMGLMAAAAGEAGPDMACAGLGNQALDPGLASTLMQEVGAELTAATTALSKLKGRTFDLVVTLDDEARERCLWSDIGEGDEPGPPPRDPLLAGIPVLLHWDVIPDGDGEDDLREARELLADHVGALAGQGFFNAIIGQRRRWVRLLDTLQDGVMAHDVHRRIFLFNREAERICGVKREEVLGRDCHELFEPDGLCGSHCKFCEPTEPAAGRAEWETTFTARDGVDRRLKMSVSPLQLEEDRDWGVIISMHDISEVSELRHRLHKERNFHGMVTNSPRMQEVFAATRQIGTSDYPVLITGESGTGKELMASAIHNESRRSNGPFVPINCGALPDNILESELFGHVRGAFTGAIRNKKGRFEMAHGGTLFLDEVGELSPSFQVKLLRVLQEKRFEMVGGERTIEVDVRVISATNQDLRQMISEGSFREDLYYRLCVFPLELPPLRDRREDIPPIVEHALKKVRQETDSKVKVVTSEAMATLLSYHWPGNVRELINAVQFASVLCGAEEIKPHNLPPEVRHASTTPPPEVPEALQAAMVPSHVRSERKRKLDWHAVEAALAEAGGNKVKAAKILNVGRATLYRFLKDNPR